MALEQPPDGFLGPQFPPHPTPPPPPPPASVEPPPEVIPPAVEVGS